ncbi:MAG TPA: MBL fold metallo-hydrolase [Alphaproteobacteria bacterium]|nr:MBL fold metallo-hydrolase [Alphaproteobacteria bacterium]
MINRLGAVFLAALLAAAALPALAQTTAPLPAQFAQAGPIREITKIAGEIYRFRNNNHYSIFVVTPAGIIATDPINRDAATWLKGELQRRFNLPVRYLVYSHDHADHISGGEAFADTATVVAHERAREVIIGEKRPTAVPSVTFSERGMIDLGGTVMQLVYTGRNHSDNSIVMYFPVERVLFAVDFIPVESVAFRDFPDAYMPDWIESLRRVEQIDFDILVPGHGPLGRKQHVTAFREYLEDLRNQVLALARDGKSVDEAKRMVNLDKYRTWAGFEQMSQLNIEGMYRLVQANRRGN